METSYTRLGGFASYLWLVSSFLALLCFSFGGVIVAQHSAYPYHIKLTSSLSFLMLSITMIVCFAVKFFIQNKRLPRISDTNLVRNNRIAPGVLLGFFGGFLTSLAQLSYCLGWSFDENGRGIIISIGSGSIILTILLTYLFFDERFHMCEIIGICIGTCGLIYLSLESSLDGTWLAYLLGIACLVFWGFRNLIARKMNVEGLDPYTGGILNSSGEACFGTLIFIGLLFDGFEIFEEDFNFSVVLVGCFIVALGTFFINQALMIGKIGVSLSIVNTQGALFIFLEYIFFGVQPSLTKVIAALIIISGVIVVFVGDSTLGLFKKKNTEVQVQLS